MLPNDVTGRELIQQFVDDGCVIDISTSRRPEGYVLKAEGKNDIVLSEDGGDQTISEVVF